MSAASLPLHRVPWLPRIVRDYLARPADYVHLAPHPPSMEGAVQAAERLRQYDFPRRELQHALEGQYRRTFRALSRRYPRVAENIRRLGRPGSVAVVGGQQIHLWGGPLYVAAKIETILNLAEALSRRLGQAVVPIFWMHTEDHDYEEIRCVQYEGAACCSSFEPEAPHPVGRLPAAAGMPDAMGFPEAVARTFPFYDAFEAAYAEESSLADATRRWITAIWGERGLVVIDPLDPLLKQTAGALFRQEFEDRLIHRNVSDLLAEEGWRWGRKAIVPRAVNAFWLDPEHGRQRIEAVDGTLIAGERSLPPRSWGTHPEQISPNVLFRPLYQQRLLPAAATVLGPAEIAYWLQLYPAFREAGLFYPALMPRTWFAAVPQPLWQWWAKTGLPPEWLLDESHILESRFLDHHLRPLAALEHRLTAELAEAEPDILRLVRGHEGPYWAFRKSLEKELRKLRQRLRKVMRERRRNELARLHALHHTIGVGGSFYDRRRHLIECGAGPPADLMERFARRIRPGEATLEIIPY